VPGSRAPSFCSDISVHPRLIPRLAKGRRGSRAWRLGAAACDAFQADSRPAEAALAALQLGLFHLARGDEPRSMGWIGRAGRLAEGIPQCPVHGYLQWFTEVELGHRPRR
jgi:hypothetical protein